MKENIAYVTQWAIIKQLVKQYIQSIINGELGSTAKSQQVRTDEK